MTGKSIKLLKMCPAQERLQTRYGWAVSVSVRINTAVVKVGVNIDANTTTVKNVTTLRTEVKVSSRPNFLSPYTATNWPTICARGISMSVARVKPVGPEAVETDSAKKIGMANR
jgi:hypothetical protein